MTRDQRAKEQIDNIHAWICFNISGMGFEVKKDLTPRQAVDRIFELMAMVYETKNFQLDKIARAKIVQHVHNAWQGRIDSNADEEEIKFAKEVYELINEEINCKKEDSGQ